ncbi:MAG: ribonuclease HII [bacterium]
MKENLCNTNDEKWIEHLLQYERKFWNQGILNVAGIDEAGRGPLAGPVVAAAVIFSPDIFISGINDSKQLSSKRREDLFWKIKDKAITVATGIVSEKEIDKINIYQATLKAMRIAVGKLNRSPDHLLIDGLTLSESSCDQTGIKGGDGRCFSIASASIVAKVTRDNIMIDYDKKYPEYNFFSNKGYGTKEHVAAIRKYGRCEIHRASFTIKGWT